VCGHVAELALNRILELCQRQLADAQRDGARLDLREVEDVVEQAQQVVTRGADHARVLDLSLREVLLGV
jgi:hypothetical protein